MAGQPIKFRCPQCSQLLGASLKKAGRTIRCPKCDGQVVVPNPKHERASSFLKTSDETEVIDEPAQQEPTVASEPEAPESNPFSFLQQEPEALRGPSTPSKRRASRRRAEPPSEPDQPWLEPSESEPEPDEPPINPVVEPEVESSDTPGPVPGSTTDPSKEPEPAEASDHEPTEVSELSLEWEPTAEPASADHEVTETATALAPPDRGLLSEPAPKPRREVVLPRLVVVSWSLFVLFALFLAFVAGLFVGHYVWVDPSDRPSATTSEQAQ